MKKNTIIITGASSGIGKATALLLANNGFEIFNLDRAEQEFQHENIRYYNCDVASYEEVKNVIQLIAKNIGFIDGLFANAGIFLFGDLVDTSIDDMKNMIDTNLLGTLYVVKEVLPIMRKQKTGNILLMGSEQSFIGKAKNCIYGLTKGAIAQLTKNLCIDNAKYNIRVNCVCPGTIDTPGCQNIIEEISNKHKIDKIDIYNSINKAQPIKAMGSPNDVAEFALFIFSEKCHYMTGALVSIDGGSIAQ